jgi:hypothetical protein
LPKLRRYRRLKIIANFASRVARWEVLWKPQLTAICRALGGSRKQKGMKNWKKDK